MVEKRGHEENADNGNAEAAKKARMDGAIGPTPGPGPASGVAKPGLSLEALEKAKKALQLQKELKEKLKNIPQLQRPTGSAAPAAAAPGGTPAAVNPILAAATAKAAQIAARFGVPVVPAPAAAPAAAAAPPGFKPAPLRLDAQGREIDEHGHLIHQPVMPTTTLRVHQQAHAPGPAPVKHLVIARAPEPEETQFFDPRMGAPGQKKLERRRKATFDFVQEGVFQKQAEVFRLKSQYGENALRKPRGPIGPALQGDPNLVPIGGNPNLIPIGANPNLIPIGKPEGDQPLSIPGLPPTEGEEEVEEPPEFVPEVEWWDKALLPTPSYEENVNEDGTIKIRENKITHYVEHPVLIEPPAEAPPPPPQPLKLTKRELKKLRTQRRQAREKEKQEQIRQGLLEPPKPKVKISNLYRVLGEQAVADPTALEMETRKQMAERHAAHEDRNLARKLAPDEARDKKMRKLFDDTGLEQITSVYRITRLDNPQHRFKVDVNAKENHMTGVLLQTPDMNLVVVEGCSKSTKRYAKLMLRRIDWDVGPPGADDDAMEEEEEEEGKEPNACDLVWQGLVKEPSFKDFKVENCRTVEHAQQILAQHGVGHYWDVAKNFNREEAPPIEL